MLYFDSDQGLATQESIQDMRPAKVSISGGQFYDNYFSIDGVGVNSRLDVVDIGNPQDYNEAAGGSAQSIWLDSNLLESVTVRDSNVSARYGGFTGGGTARIWELPDARRSNPVAASRRTGSRRTRRRDASASRRSHAPIRGAF